MQYKKAKYHTQHQAVEVAQRRISHTLLSHSKLTECAKRSTKQGTIV